MKACIDKDGYHMTICEFDGWSVVRCFQDDGYQYYQACIKNELIHNYVDRWTGDDGYTGFVKCRGGESRPTGFTDKHTNGV